jgi:hypothetical protein
LPRRRAGAARIAAGWGFGVGPNALFLFLKRREKDLIALRGGLKLVPPAGSRRGGAARPGPLCRGDATAPAELVLRGGERRRAVWGGGRRPRARAHVHHFCASSGPPMAARSGVAPGAARGGRRTEARGPPRRGWVVRAGGVKSFERRAAELRVDRLGAGARGPGRGIEAGGGAARSSAEEGRPGAGGADLGTRW